MARDNRTYGFNLADAQGLAELIGGRAAVFETRRPMGGGALVLYRFETTADYSSGTSVSAEILTMSGSVVSASGTVNDPDQIFTGIASGTKGLAVYQGGTYYIIQAACGA